MDNNFPISLERVMEMSLDEYIIESGIYVPPSLRQSPLEKVACNVDYVNGNTNNLANNEDRQKSDLYDKFTELNISSKIYNDLPKKRSIQDRLDFSKVSDKNKREMRNIPPMDVTEIIRGISNNPVKNKNNRNQNWNKKAVVNQNSHRYEMNSSNINGKRCPQEFDKTIRGKVQKRLFQRNYISSPQQQTYFKNSTTTIECPNVFKNALNFNDSSNTTNSNVNVSTSVSSIHNSDGGLKTEMLPLIAKNLLKFILQGDKAEDNIPKYDLKLQKEIHCIQNKQMTYKCPGGEVISSDGPGVEECRLVPSSTGMSLNQRFA